MVSETPGLFSVARNIILYHFFEMILILWHTVLEPCLLLSPDDWIYVTTEHDWALTATSSCLLLTVAKYVKKRILCLRL